MGTTYSPCPECNTVNSVIVEKAMSAVPHCAKCKSALTLEGAVSVLSGNGLKALVKRSPIPVVVDFWADWCGPCKFFAPQFLKAAEQMSGKVAFAKLDTEKYPQVTHDFEIRGIPSIIVFKNNQEVIRQAGAMTLEIFLHWLDQAISQ